MKSAPDPSAEEKALAHKRLIIILAVVLVVIPLVLGALRLGGVL